MKTLYLINASLLVASLAGCAVAPPQVPAQPVQISTPSAEQISLLSRLVLARLKDPDSAKLDKVFIVDGKGACLGVNARNAFGGYTGIQQAMLANIPGLGWQLLDIKGISPELCAESLHRTLSEDL